LLLVLFASALLYLKAETDRSISAAILCTGTNKYTQQPALVNVHSVELQIHTNTKGKVALEWPTIV